MHPETVAAVVLAVLLGFAVGMGSYTFVYARGASYLGDDPEACANCHVMRAHYDAWLKSSHRLVAVCNDCHTPASFLSKYRVKIVNGFRHSFAFTTGRFHEPFRIKPPNAEVTERRCRSCHQEIVEAIEGPHGRGEKESCARCHDAVGHAT